jgi:hypothetical protein
VTTAAAAAPRFSLDAAMAAREARMGTAIQDAEALGHVQTLEGTSLTCSCGDTSEVNPRAARVVMDAHAREKLGTLSIPTIG